MPGGLSVLVANGAQDQLLTGGNPEVYHFKYVARTYSHHSKEPMYITPVGSVDPPNQSKKTILRFPIPRSGDYLSSANLLYTLPTLRIPNTSGSKQVRWVRKPGMALIEEARVIVGGTEVQVLDRDRILALYSVDESADNRRLMDTMVGDDASLVAPSAGPYKRTAPIFDPNGNVTVYPYATSTADTLTIPSRRIRIPLPFWFTRAIAESLPIGFLTLHECEIIITIRPWTHLIQIRDNETDTWRRPETAFNLLSYIPKLQWLPNPLLEGVYHFLPSNTRKEMALDEIRVPVFALNRYETSTLENRGYFANPHGTTPVVPVKSEKAVFHIDQETHPVTRFIILARRNDFIDKNNWTRLGNWETPDTARNVSNDTLHRYTDEIIQSCSFLTNGHIIFEDIPRGYLTEFDTYKHSKGIGNTGIACYSFGIENQPDMPSGTMNLGRVRNPIITVKVTPPSIAPSGYTVTLFVESVNWFTYSRGFGGLKYA